MPNWTMGLSFCQMCGAIDGDEWETCPGKEVIFSPQPRSIFEKWTLCNECNDGLQNTALPKPDRVHLLAQIRRATIDDQEAVLNWLLGKFGKVAVKKIKRSPAN